MWLVSCVTVGELFNFSVSVAMSGNTRAYHMLVFCHVASPVLLGVPQGESPMCSQPVTGWLRFQL